MDVISQMIKLSGRSWWEVRYLGGRTIGEWETAEGRGVKLLPLSGAAQKSSRWEQLDHAKIVAARLLCPTGDVGELQAARPWSVFQFKSGGRAPQGDWINGHVLGVLVDDGEPGDCRCWVFEPAVKDPEGKLITPARMTSFLDNVLNFRRYGVGPLNLEALGVRVA